MNPSASLTRCLGTADPECADCARRTTREQVRAQSERDGIGYVWWMTPPVERPCAQRVTLDDLELDSRTNSAGP